MDDQLKEAEYERIKAETEKLKAEKTKIDGEQKRYKLKIFLQPLFGALILGPMIWFYWEKIGAPLSEAEHYKVNLENQKNLTENYRLNQENQKNLTEIYRLNQEFDIKRQKFQKDSTKLESEKSKLRKDSTKLAIDNNNLRVEKIQSYKLLSEDADKLQMLNRSKDSTSKENQLINKELNTLKQQWKEKLAQDAETFQNVQINERSNYWDHSLTILAKSSISLVADTFRLHLHTKSLVTATVLDSTKEHLIKSIYYFHSSKEENYDLIWNHTDQNNQKVISGKYFFHALVIRSSDHTVLLDEYHEIKF